MSFRFQGRVEFRDTDAAGVVYFANVLSYCHLAYEASLEAAGISLRDYFTQPEMAVPIVKAEVEYFRPLHCGNLYLVDLTPQLLSAHKFQIDYQLIREDKLEKVAAQALTQHICIDTDSRQRIPVPEPLRIWLDQWSAPVPRM